MAPLRPPTDFGALVHRALADEPLAWVELVDALKPIVWKALLSFALEPAERDDVFSVVFLRLYERLETVHEPAALPGWIRTVVRNEVYAVTRARQRHQVVIDLDLDATATLAGATDDGPDAVEERSAEADLRAAMAEALADLPEHERRLLRLLSLDPRPSYDEVAATLGIPVGSIGPTYGRAKQRLARHRALIRYQASVAV